MDKKFITSNKHGRFVAMARFSSRGGRIVIDSAEMTEEQKRDFFDIPYDASQEVVELAEKILKKDKSAPIESIELTDKGDILVNCVVGNENYSFVVRKSFCFYVYTVSGLPTTKCKVEYRDLKTRVSEYELVDKAGETIWEPKYEMIVDPHGSRVVEFQ